jgi:hypothetical protein
LFKFIYFIIKKTGFPVTPSGVTNELRSAVVFYDQITNKKYVIVGVAASGSLNSHLFDSNGAIVYLFIFIILKIFYFFFFFYFFFIKNYKNYFR